MVNTMISIPGYVHLYRSLLRFYDMPENEVREMLYLLNTANLDCYEYYHPDRSVIQSGPVAFCGWLETKDCRPYRTEVQLYKSLLFLKRSIDRDLIVSGETKIYRTIIPERISNRFHISGTGILSQWKYIRISDNLLYISGRFCGLLS